MGTTASALWLTALACNVGGRKIPAKRQRTDRQALACAHARLPGKYPLGIRVGTRSLSTRRDTLTSFNSDSCCACSSCCRADLPAPLLPTLGSVSKQILINFFVSTHKDQWFCAKRYLILGSITSLNWGDITVLMVSYWSRGLVLLVLTRKRNLKGSICFKLTNKCWKTFSEKYDES